MWSYADLCDRIYAVAAPVRAFYASAAASLQVSLNRHQAVRFVGQTVKSAVALVIIFSLLAWVPEVEMSKARQVGSSLQEQPGS